MSKHARLVTAGIVAAPGVDVTHAPWSPEADLYCKLAISLQLYFMLLRRILSWVNTF